MGAIGSLSLSSPLAWKLLPHGTSGRFAWCRKISLSLGSSLRRDCQRSSQVLLEARFAIEHVRSDSALKFPDRVE